jgi:hypothetical protein
MARLAEAIRQLPDGDREREVRTSFFCAVERLQAAIGPLNRDWDAGGKCRDTPLWTVGKKGRETAAVLRYIDDYGYELRLLEDGQLRKSRMFGGRGGQALSFAMSLQQQLEQRGWRAAP